MLVSIVFFLIAVLVYLSPSGLTVISRPESKKQCVFEHKQS